MKKVLFISFSSRSTGEISYLIGALNEGVLNGLSLNLVISPKLSLVAEKFPGQVHFHDLKPTDSCQKIINFLEQICHAGDIIVLIDITNLCLEYLFTEKKQVLFAKCLTEIAYKKKVFVIDYFKTITSHEAIYDERRKRTEEQVRKLTYNLPGKPFEMYYFTKFLKVRSLNLVMFLPPEVTILRPLPLTFSSSDEENVISYKAVFWQKMPSMGKEKRILITFSGFFANRVVQPRHLKEMFIGVCERLVAAYDPEEIIFIDPIGILPDKTEIKSVVLRCYPWLKRDNFINLVSQVTLTAAFVPYATIGMISLLNRVPFISLYSTRPSSEVDWLDEAFKPIVIPPFRGFGIWEDIAFYHELSEQNQYLKAVSFLDISDEREFPRVIHEIEDHAEQRIFDFLENYEQLQAPLLAEVLKSMED